MNLVIRLVLPLLLTMPTPRAQNLIANGTFDDGTTGWQNQSADAGEARAGWIAAGRDGTGCLHDACATRAKDEMHIWRHVLPEVPTGKRLRFAGFVRGKQVGFIGICVQVWDRDHEQMVGFGTTQGIHDLTGDFDWTRIDGTVAVRADAGAVHLLTMLSGGGEAWFDDIEVVVDGDAAEHELTARFGAKTGKPGLFEVRGEYTVGRQRGWFGARRTEAQPTLLFPVPLAYATQVPLSYEIEVTPVDHLVSTRIYEDRPGNFVAEVVLRTPLADAGTQVRWRSIVLCGPSDFRAVPKVAPLPAEWPAEAQPWLASTRICQAEDPALQAEGQRIRGGSEDVIAIVEATLQRAAAIRRQQEGRCDELDALEALQRQGSCTSNANLLAALLRAQGVPARVLSGYPVWSGPLQTHYIVEAWVPSFGWYPIESTLLQAPWPGHAQIAVCIVPVEYEGDLSRPRECAAGGVPYLSLTEARHPPGLFTQESKVDGKEHCDHVAKQVQAILDLEDGAWAEVLDAARGRWLSWVRQRGEPAVECATPRRSVEWLEVTTGAALRGKLAPR